MNDDDSSLGTLWDVGPFNHLEKDEIPFPKCSYPPGTETLESPVRGASPASNHVKVPPRPHSGESLAAKEIFPEVSCKLAEMVGGIVYMIANITNAIFFFYK